jgi:hypothetical protein
MRHDLASIKSSTTLLFEVPENLEKSARHHGMRPYGTLKEKLIKIGAKVVSHGIIQVIRSFSFPRSLGPTSSTRRVKWPHRNLQAP